MTSQLEIYPRTYLNNTLQSMYGDTVREHVKWEVVPSGSPNSPTWHATVYIDDMNYGNASATTKGVAQDQAALKAYNNLQREGMTRARGR